MMICALYDEAAATLGAPRLPFVPTLGELLGVLYAIYKCAYPYGLCRKMSGMKPIRL